MNKKVMIIVIAIVVIIIAIGFFLKFENKVIEENYDGNFMNMGLAIKDGEYIYYNKYPEGIYRIDNTGIESKIVEDLAYSININDEWIFYATLGNSYKLDIIKVKKDGSEREVITSINSISTLIYLEGDWIYYLNNEGGNSFITKVSIDGEKKSRISEAPIQKFQVTKEHIYYTDLNNRIRRMNLDGTNDIEIQGAGNVKNYFQVTGNYIYYIGVKSNELERTDLKSNKSCIISNDVFTEPFNIIKNVVYYYNSDIKMICSLNIDTLEKRQLVKINGGNTFINVVDDNIFYLDDLQIFKIKIND